LSRCYDKLELIGLGSQWLSFSFQDSLSQYEYRRTDIRVRRFLECADLSALWFRCDLSQRLAEEIFQNFGGRLQKTIALTGQCIPKCYE
jgi:hypothetical protein